MVHAELEQSILLQVAKMSLVLVLCITRRVILIYVHPSLAKDLPPISESSRTSWLLGCQLTQQLPVGRMNPPAELYPSQALPCRPLL